MNNFSASFMNTVLLQTVAWPLLAMSAGMSIGQFGLRRYQSQRGASLVSAVALGVGFLTAYVLIYGQFTFPPLQALDWLPLLLLMVFVLFTVDEVANFAPVMRWGIQGAVILLASGLLLHPILMRTAWVSAILTCTAVTVLWFGVWLYLNQRAYQDASSAVSLPIVAVGSAVVLTMTGSIMLGQLSGAVAVILGGWLLWNWRQTCCPLGYAGTAVIVLALGSLLLVGHFYSEAPTGIILLLISALTANTLAARLLPVRGRFTIVLTALVALLFITLAIGLTQLFYMSKTGESGGY